MGIVQKVRRWLSMLFGKSKELNEILQTQVSEEHYSLIEKWKAIYTGYYEEWHKIKINTINQSEKTYFLKSLNMAKKSSEEMSKLIFTEKVSINISAKEFNENINKVLRENRFYKMFQGKLEQMFAMGGLVLKSHPKENEDGTYSIKINYVSSDSFIPLTYENGEIKEGVFLNIAKKKDKTYCLFEFHEWKVAFIKDDETGETRKEKVYQIRNELYESDQNGSGQAKPVPLSVLYPGLDKVTVVEGLTQSMFVYIKPNIANNFDTQSPLGISLYANALDTLHALDVAFDSYFREFRLGKRRIIVPASAVQTVVDPQTQQVQRYFDANDEVYEAMNFENPEKQQIRDNTVQLRVDEHVAGINALLNLYAMQTGMSAGTYTFDGQSVKTATEVVSENSQTFRTKVAHENLIEEGLAKFIRVLGEVASLYDVFDEPDEDYEIEFFWDDSIIKDQKADSDFWIKLKNSDIVSNKYSIMQILDLTEKEAEQMLEEIKKEKVTMNPDMEDMLGSNE